MVSMRKFGPLLLVAGIAAIATTCFASEPVSDVHVLTTDGFDQFVKDNKFVLVEFYAPWCTHCKSLAPHWEEAATKLKASGNARLAKIDATAETELASRFEVRGYPTIKLFKDGEPTEYTGGRTADTIVSWVESVTGPAVVTVAESAAVAPESGVLFVARVKDTESAEYKTFENVAEALRLNAKFAVITSASATNTVTVYRASEDVQTHKIGKEADLQKWISEERFPFFGPIDADNYAAYEAREQELVWFAGTAEDYASHGAGIRESAKTLRDTYSFVWLDTSRFSSHAENGLGITNIPGLVLRLKEGGRYLYPSGKKFAGKELNKFFNDVKAGKVEKFLKSEPIPETNDDPVKVVVGQNFEDLVMRKDKDVLLEVYAPWCGHCKRLEPIYNELAEKMESVKHIVIAKMDGTANEAPVPDFDVRGFPTIFFLKAGETKPETFSGDRSLAALVSYIKENSSKPVDVVVEVEADDAKDEL